MSETPHLLETCLEGGPLTEPAMREALAGQARSPIVAAILSKLEHSISDARNVAETPGTDSKVRDETAGAIHSLKVLRLWILQQTAAEKPPA